MGITGAKSALFVKLITEIGHRISATCVGGWKQGSREKGGGGRGVETQHFLLFDLNVNDVIYIFCRTMLERMIVFISTFL